MFVRDTKDAFFLLECSFDTGASARGHLCRRSGGWPEGIDEILKVKRKRIW